MIIKKDKIPKNPLIKLIKDLECTDLTNDEMNDILENYKKTISYGFYELGIALNELKKCIKKDLKKCIKILKTICIKKY